MSERKNTMNNLIKRVEFLEAQFKALNTQTEVKAFRQYPESVAVEPEYLTWAKQLADADYQFFLDVETTPDNEKILCRWLDNDEVTIDFSEVIQVFGNQFPALPRATITSALSLAGIKIRQKYPIRNKSKVMNVIDVSWER